MKRTIEMTGVIDMTRGDADVVRETVIARDIANDDHYVIAYDYQLEEILRPMIWGVGDKRDEPAFTKELTHAWYWRDEHEVEFLMGHLGVSIEYFKDFLKENEGEWTYPDGVIRQVNEQ